MKTQENTTPEDRDHRNRKIYDVKSEEARKILAKQKVQGYTRDFGYVERVNYFDLYIPVPQVGDAKRHNLFFVSSVNFVLDDDRYRYDKPTTLLSLHRIGLAFLLLLCCGAFRRIDLSRQRVLERQTSLAKSTRTACVSRWKEQGSWQKDTLRGKWCSTAATG